MPKKTQKGSAERRKICIVFDLLSSARECSMTKTTQFHFVNVTECHANCQRSASHRYLCFKRDQLVLEALVFLLVALHLFDVAAQVLGHAGVLLLDARQGVLHIPVEPVDLSCAVQLLASGVHLFQKLVPVFSAIAIIIIIIIIIFIYLFFFLIFPRTLNFVVLLSFFVSIKILNFTSW